MWLLRFNLSDCERMSTGKEKLYYVVFLYKCKHHCHYLSTQKTHTHTSPYFFMISDTPPLNHNLLWKQEPAIIFLIGSHVFCLTCHRCVYDILFYRSPECREHLKIFSYCAQRGRMFLRLPPWTFRLLFISPTNFQKTALK